MTPEIAALQAQVAELLAWKAAREAQPIAAALDDVSKTLIGAVISNGPGSTTLTQTIAVSGTTPASNVIVPRPYIGSTYFNVDGTLREFGYIS